MIRKLENSHGHVNHAQHLHPQRPPWSPCPLPGGQGADPHEQTSSAGLTREIGARGVFGSSGKIICGGPLTLLRGICSHNSMPKRRGVHGQCDYTPNLLLSSVPAPLAPSHCYPSKAMPQLQKSLLAYTPEAVYIYVLADYLLTLCYHDSML